MDENKTAQTDLPIGEDLAGIRDQLRALAAVYVGLRLEHDVMADEVTAELDAIQRYVRPARWVAQMQARREFQTLDLLAGPRNHEDYQPG